MKDLLLVELQKIGLNRADRILILCYFILFSFIALLASLIYKLNPSKLYFAEMDIFKFSYIRYLNTYFNNFFKFFFGYCYRYNDDK